MRTLNFAKRNLKEIIRDPLSIIFAILLPLFLLFIFQQVEIPSEAYSLENFAPGTVVFGFSFITLFTAVLVAKDRGTALITRLCAGPMKTRDYILGYTLAVLPMVLLQNVLFFAAAVLLGLEFSVGILLAIVVSVPVSVIFIMLGILIGSVTSEKSASGVSSVVVQLVAFTSGMYFSGDMIGDAFAAVCKALPFSNCLDIVKGVLNGNYENLLVPSIIVAAYIVVLSALTSVLFLRKLKSDNK
ncbi:MAG: ABC transporter permease [Elusimicrobiaceae bacterium]|nr:ABC transporter permease [Elusimicrobiaceae bacterium]